MTTGRSSSRRVDLGPAVGVLVGAAACLLFAAPAGAHRLDEYLQTAHVSVKPDRVVVDVYLSPGSDVAPAVIRSIDMSGDGSISSDEERAYATAVISRASIRLDDVPLRVSLHAFEYPAMHELVAGTGSIRVTASAPTGVMSEGTHVLSVENGFHPPASIYMASAMLPETSAIEILDQERNGQQTQLIVEFRANPGFGRVGELVWATSWAVGALAVVVLFLGSLQNLGTAARVTWHSARGKRPVTHQGETS